MQNEGYKKGARRGTLYFVTMLVRSALEEKLEEYRKSGFQPPDDVDGCIDALCAHLYEGVMERWVSKETSGETS